MNPRNPEDTATVKDITDALIPLFLALHERGVIPLGELSMQYEDVLARRTLENGESPASTDLLRQLVIGLHRLSSAVQARERAAKGDTDTPPTA